MISVTEAQKIILGEVKPMRAEQLFLSSALHRVLADDVAAGLDHPPWDNSGMDGYAVRAQDLLGASDSTPALLKIIGEIQAGRVPERALEPGEALSIMTGAPIPPGADAVVELERTESDGATVKFFREAAPGRNIRRRGENVRKGETVLTRGTVLGPPEIGLLALLGKSCLSVYHEPEVAILATGDELAGLDETPREGQIYNVNSYALEAQVREAGGIPHLLGIVKDHKELFRERLREALASDAILISGSVSMGKYDFAREVMAECGIKIRFRTVAIRPGHPVIFGLQDRRIVFGLPGNPVSTMITFEELVRPALLKMSGRPDIFRPVVEAVLMEPLGNRPGRTHFVRARIEYRDGRFYARSAGPQGSGILMSMVKANGLIILPADREKLEAGESVKVQLLESRWGWRGDPG